jgi:hypothetical protein
MHAMLPGFIGSDEALIADKMPSLQHDHCAARPIIGETSRRHDLAPEVLTEGLPTTLDHHVTTRADKRSLLRRFLSPDYFKNRRPDSQRWRAEPGTHDDSRDVAARIDANISGRCVTRDCQPTLGKGR